MNSCSKYCLIILLISSYSLNNAQSFTLQGQASVWLTSIPENNYISQVGVRYIPNLFIEKSLTDKYFVDAELSINTYLFSDFNDWKSENETAKLKPYRLWLRISSNQFEARAGLQKINFGSAMLFRPLMWFDRIDPRDPLKLTDGVYGLLLRYYFQNNANIWLWALYDNNDLKGWEIAPTKDNGIEFGGRFQTLIFTGEAGITYHHRKADFTQLPALVPDINKNVVDENRFAFDCRWDFEIGLLFEGTLNYCKTELALMKYQCQWTIGADYTFNIGNGLYILTEFYNSESSDKIFGSGDGIKFSALSANYPIGLLDKVSGIYYYDWTNRDSYVTLNWQRTYDNWLFYIIGFFNPEIFRLNQTQSDSNVFSGNGFQIMVVFNH